MCDYWDGENHRILYFQIQPPFRCKTAGPWPMVMLRCLFTEVFFSIICLFPQDRGEIGLLLLVPTN